MTEGIGEGALVVRGGVGRNVGDLLGAIEDALTDGDGPVVSVYCGWPADSNESCASVVEAICREALVAGSLPHNKIQVAEASEVLALGVELVHDSSDGQASNHYHVTFQVPVTESQVQSFIEVFGEPILNPVPREERLRR